MRQRKKGPGEEGEHEGGPLLPLVADKDKELKGKRDKRFSSAFSIEGNAFNYLDIWLTIIMLVLGIFTRLQWISHPRGIVFDEIHFTKFTNWYVSGKYFLDIHPPLAKLAMAAVMHFWLGTASLNFNLSSDANSPHRV